MTDNPRKAMIDGIEPFVCRTCLNRVAINQDVIEQKWASRHSLGCWIDGLRVMEMSAVGRSAESGVVG